MKKIYLGRVKYAESFSYFWMTILFPDLTLEQTMGGKYKKHNCCFLAKEMKLHFKITKLMIYSCTIIKFSLFHYGLQPF